MKRYINITTGEKVTVLSEDTKQCINYIRDNPNEDGKTEFTKPKQVFLKVYKLL